MKKYVIAISMAALLAASCTTTNKAVSATDLNGEWTVEKVNGTAIDKSKTENEVFLGFNVAEKRVYGSAGCNRLTGSFEVTADGIDLSKTGATRMMCADMTTEDMILGAMPNIKSFRTGKNGTLQLTDASGKTVMELKKK